MMHEDPSLKVSTRLRALRRARRLTLRDLSKASGLSANTISLIEREKSSPTISTLHKLAKALGVRVNSFLEEGTEKHVIFTQQAQQRSTRSGRALLRSLGIGLVNQTMEPLLITLEPDADSGPEPMTHLGHEFAFCLEGRISYEIQGEQYLLSPGDSLLFEASLPHRWRNDLSKSSELLVVVQAANGTHNALV